VNRLAPPTTWLFVTTFPRASNTTPEPSPEDVWIWTTAGETVLTTLTNLPWIVSADGLMVPG
jgi:hypothetical protein